MAFVNTISFSHRFSDDAVAADYCSYQEINHVYSADNATAMARSFYQFMMACGYAPQSTLDGMANIVTEYQDAYCYNGGKANE